MAQCLASHGKSTAAPPGERRAYHRPLWNHHAPGRFGSSRCTLMVSPCLTQRALCRGSAGSRGARRKRVPSMSGQGLLLGATRCFVPFLLAKPLVSGSGAWPEALPVLTTARARMSSPVPPASLRRCPQRGALASPLVLAVLPGPRHPPPTGEAQHTPERLGTSLAERPLIREETLQGEPGGPRARRSRAARTATDSPCPKGFTGKGTLPAKVYTSA